MIIDNFQYILHEAEVRFIFIGDAAAKMAFVKSDNEVDFFAKSRSNAKKKSAEEIPYEAQKMAKKRPLIETVIGIQKMVMDLEHKASKLD